MTERELRRAVEKYGWMASWPEIEPWLRDEVLLSPSESKYDDLPVGATKQGGEPDLTPGVEWPKYKRRGLVGLRNTSKPMTFLMQLRCGDIRPFDPPPQFPDFGLLSFFVAVEQNRLVLDADDRPTGGVVFLANHFAAEPLVRTPFPRGLYFGNRFAPCSLKIDRSTGIAFEFLVEAVERHCGYSPERQDRVWDFYQRELMPVDRHKLFGPPTMLELDIVEETRLLAKTLVPPTDAADADWLLLLEYDLADSPVEDGGRLYYMIRRDDLAACRFQRTYVLHDVAKR